MRIALFSWESMHSIPVGGIALHVSELAAALQRRGNDVHVFTRLGKPNHPYYECIDGVHYHRCPFSNHGDFIEQMDNMCRSFVESFFQTENYIGKFDIVHSHDWLASNAMVWIKKGRNHKTVFTMHSTEFGRCGNNFFGGDSQRVREIERSAVHFADRVIAVSRYLKSEVAWMYNLPEWRVNVIYNGISYWKYDGWVDPASVKANYGIGPMDPTVLFVGRMVYQKGPDLLLDAIPHLLRFYPNAKFVFVGDGQMRRQIEEGSISMGVSHATRFLGAFNGWRLKDLFRACDVVCIPSRNEPFGIVILEAWSAGKPVVASINGGPSEIIWHDVNGYKIYANPDSVGWGIGNIFKDFEHARWMGRNGRVAAETAFSWDVVAGQVEALYKS